VCVHYIHTHTHIHVCVAARGSLFKIFVPRESEGRRGVRYSNGKAQRHLSARCSSVGGRPMWAKAASPLCGPSIRRCGLLRNPHASLHLSNESVNHLTTLSINKRKHSHPKRQLAAQSPSRWARHRPYYTAKRRSSLYRHIDI